MKFKLFYKRDYVKLKEDYESIVKRLDKAVENKVLAEISLDNIKHDKEIVDKQKVDLEAYNQVIIDVNNELKIQKDELFKDLQERDSKIKTLSGSNRWYKGTNNKLRKEKKELLIQIENLKSDRYLVKKIPPGKTPGTQKTKIRSKVTPKIAKYQKIQLDELKGEEAK